MIWDEVRKQSPELCDPAIQVIKVPFRIFKSWEHGRFEIDPGDIRKAFDLIPRDTNGAPDMSWVKYPFKDFVLVDGSSLSAIFCHNEDATDGQPGWRSATALVTLSKHGGFGILAAHYFIVQNGKIHAAIDRDKSAFSDACRAMNLPPLTLDKAGNTDPDKDATYKILIDQMGAYVIAAMALMSCKNVTMVEHIAPRQQRRHSERNGLLPPTSWHELVVRAGTSGDHEGTQQCDPIALHWVRGHFADHRERGLFGKHKGIYWWSPHLSGRADRVVHKTYVIPEPECEEKAEKAMNPQL